MRAPPAAFLRPRRHLWWMRPFRMIAGGSGPKERARRRTRKPKPDPTALLADDLLVEILARVPYRSLCRCRCVSTRWRALISHPDRRARLPQTLAGILYTKPFDAAAAAASADPEFNPPRYGFSDVSGAGGPHQLIDPSFSFLPSRERERLVLADCCDGLLLCRSYRFAGADEFDYLVFNPATEEWVAVPVTRRWTNKVQTVRLGFDRAVSHHFYVFEFQLDMDDDDDDDGDDWRSCVLGVKIYSSTTGVWIHKQSRWSMEILPQIDCKSVFLDGVLYVVAVECVIGAVDVEGGTWRIIEFPRSKDSPFHYTAADTASGFIDLSQGKLHFANGNDIFGDKLAVWVLEDKDSEEWTLKHTARFKHLIGMERVLFGFQNFIAVSIHPDRNMVFFVSGRERTLMSYDMDSGKVCVIRNLGLSGDEHFLPYVPLFSKSLPDGGNR